MNIIPEMEDHIIHLNDEDCGRFADIVDTISAESHNSAMKDQIDADLKATLFPEPLIFTNMPDASTDEMHDVCNYISWMGWNYRKLNFEMTDEQVS